MRRAAISRSASTVGLSLASLLSSCGSTPLASWRARLAAIITSSKRLSTTSRQSSTVMRAMGLPAALGRPYRFEGTGNFTGPAGHGASSCRGISDLGRPRRPQQGLQQAPVAQLLLAAAQPAGGEDRAHLGDRGLEHLVDDHVVELGVVRHLLARGRQAAGDDLLAVLAAGAHALLERGAGRRQDEDADRVGHLRADLGGALPVDL